MIKKEGLFKRLKSIEDKNEKLLEVKDKTKENIKEVTDFVDQPLSFEAKELINEIKTIQKNVDYRKLKIKGGNNVDYDFSDYKTFKEFFRDLYYRKTTIDEAKRIQEEFDVVTNALKNYAARDNKYVEAKNKLLNNVKNFYEGREKIIEGFKNEIYDKKYEQQIIVEREIKEERRRKKEKKEGQKKQDEKTTNVNKFNDWVNKEEIDIINELFKKTF